MPRETDVRSSLEASKFPCQSVRETSQRISKPMITSEELTCAGARAIIFPDVLPDSRESRLSCRGFSPHDSDRHLPEGHVPELPSILIADSITRVGPEAA